MQGLNENHRKKLIDRYVAGEATEDELLAFFGLLKTDELDLLLEEHMTLEIRSILERNQVSKTYRKNLWKYSVAASVLVCVGWGAYYIFHKTSVKQQIVKTQTHDIAPGGNKATLTLANGKKISLTDSKNGKLAAQGAVIINKTKDGQLVYSSGSASNPQTPSYNVVETPRGGQYHITLADGSRVWLNAASSLKYPASFTGNERKVELTGEAYFEVVHNSKLPFRVVTSGQTVEDIGTYFNISAYNDEPAVSTTLLEGSVKVIKGQAAATLQPGQQAVTNQGGDNIDIKNADVGIVMAWKNGLFHFDHATLQSAMRQIARWYDVDVVYEGAIPKTVINGEAYRSMKASQVFEVLNYLKVKFRIEGKKIIVTNK